MNKQDLGKELIHISKRIKRIKNSASKARQEYNNNYFKSIIGNREIGGLRSELHVYQDEDISLAKSCSSLDEWRQRFVEKCKLENHSPDCVKYLKFDPENPIFLNPPSSDCECSRSYHRVGGDSMFLVFHYEKQLKGLEARLKEEWAIYDSTLGMLFQIK